jgi:hypothetical protein
VTRCAGRRRWRLNERDLLTAPAGFSLARGYDAETAYNHCRIFLGVSLRGVDDRVDHALTEMQAIGIGVEAHFDNQAL